jgi:hypothetical protein
MMHGPEKSDLVIVAMKPANKAKEPTAEASARANAAEPVERRAGAKGNAHRQSTHWTQRQARVSQALAHIRQAFAVTHPRWEPYAGKPHVRIWCSEASCHSSGCESRQQRSPVTVVVISSNGEGDRAVESLEVKAPGGWASQSDPYRGASNLTGRSRCVNQEAPKDVPRVKRIAGGSGVPSCSDLGEGHVDIGVLDQTMIELPGVIEDGMLGRNGSESPEPPAGRLGAPAQRRHRV